MKQQIQVSPQKHSSRLKSHETTVEKTPYLSSTANYLSNSKALSAKAAATTQTKSSFKEEKSVHADAIKNATAHLSTLLTSTSTSPSPVATSVAAPFVNAVDQKENLAPQVQVKFQPAT